jgi:hypothetical protein
MSSDFPFVRLFGVLENIIDKVSLECFLDHFKKLNTVNKVDEDENSDYLDVENISSLNVELNRVISEDEVIHATKGLKNNKACGNCE